MEEVADHSHEHDVDQHRGSTLNGYQVSNESNMDQMTTNSTQVSSKETMVIRDDLPSSTGVNTKVSNTTGNAKMVSTNVQNNKEQQASVSCCNCYFL